jgi:hypothetical protein
MKYTVKDLVEFILKNRGNKCFKGWTPEQIATAVIATMKQKTLIYGADEFGNINTVMIGVKNGKDFRVVNMLSTANNGKQIVRAILDLFPDCERLHFSRKGREATWNINSRMKEHLQLN